jgi:PhnB protein
MSNRDHVQEGFTAITPYLYAKLELIDFLKHAFGAEVTHTPTPDASGNFHAEAKIGDAMILLGSGYFSDPSMAAAIYLYVPDTDAAYQRALKAGAKSVREPKAETWGDRVGGIKDPSGNTWWIATHRSSK